MKLFKIALIIGIIAVATCTDQDDPSKADATNVTVEKEFVSKKTKSMEAQFEKLFHTEEYNDGACQKVNLDDDDKNLLRPGAESAGNIPTPHKNKWKNLGKKEAAFVFDHLEFLFRDRLVKKFTHLYDTAKKLKTTKLDDPFTEEFMMRELGQGRDSKDKGLGAFLKKFDKKAYEEGITLPQVSELIELNRYYKETNPDFIKKTFLYYDFNGDGRLDRYEFILFTILINKPIFGKKQVSTEFCYDDIIDELIDPMFNFFDCDKSNTVTAEEIWKGLKKLKRGAEVHYSLFLCQFKLDFEKYYRTISVGDFILQNRHKADGVLDLDEFRIAILLGYWNRQVTATDISGKDAYNEKSKRWNEDGTQDKFCEQVKHFLPNKPKTGGNLVAQS